MSLFSRQLGTLSFSRAGRTGRIPGKPSRRTRSRAANAFLPTLVIVLISCSETPASPQEDGRLDVGVAYIVHVADQTAFVSNNDGIVVIDVADAGHPQRIGLIRDTERIGVVGISLLGDTLLTYARSLSIFHVRDPAEPILIGQFSGRGYIGAAQKQGRYVYLCYGQGGLEVVDFQDLENSVSVGYVAFSGQILNMVVREDVAYVANSSTGLEVIDISDPTVLRRIGVVPGTGGAWDIDIDGGVLYLGRHGAGVSVFGLADPTDPNSWGTSTTEARSTESSVSATGFTWRISNRAWRSSMLPPRTSSP